jgi:hypothetical protein
MGEAQDGATSLGGFQGIPYSLEINLRSFSATGA